MDVDSKILQSKRRLRMAPFPVCSLKVISFGILEREKLEGLKAKNFKKEGLQTRRGYKVQ